VNLKAATPLALALVTTAPPAAAQWTLRGSGVVSVMRHRVDAGFGVEPSGGVTLGGELVVGKGDRLALRLVTLSGSLDAAGPGAIDRDVADVGAEVEVVALPWLAAQAGVRRRTYSTVLARQRWTTLHVGAEARLRLTETGLSGIVRGAALPGVWVNGLDQPDLAFTVASGMEYHRGRASVAVLYSVERYRFPAGAKPSRREQIAALALKAGWSVTR
jgi:hypothetical protein